MTLWNLLVSVVALVSVGLGAGLAVGQPVDQAVDPALLRASPPPRAPGRGTAAPQAMLELWIVEVEPQMALTLSIAPQAARALGLNLEVSPDLGAIADLDDDGEANFIVVANPITTAGGVGVRVVPHDKSFSLGGRTLRLDGDELVEWKDGRARPKAGKRRWRLLARPRVITLPGERATIMVGEEIPYRVALRDDGTFETAYIVQGIAVTIDVETTDVERTVIKELRIRRNFVHRPEGGDELSVGRPLETAAEATMSLRLGKGELAIVRLPRLTQDEHPVFVLLEASRIEP